MGSRRVVVWYSCGATSAVAAKIAIRRWGRDTIVAYCETGSEHPDNARFIRDCEDWFGQSIVKLQNAKYRDIWDVFERTRYLVGVRGARCTTELKKIVRQDFQQIDDIQVFGFDVSERARVARWKTNNHEIDIRVPLIDAGLTKSDCLGLIERAGIRIPEMYRLGYNNNNCIGCVKGGAGYWNKIRLDFPDVFSRMAAVERSLDVAICKTYSAGVRHRVFLDELAPDAGRYGGEPSIECSLFCSAAEAQL